MMLIVPSRRNVERGKSTGDGAKRDGKHSAQNGFTLIELLVAISVIGVLVSMLIPAVNLARESSRKAKCQGNLRQIGIGLTMYANNNKGQLCSGAFDWKRDGVVTEVGWVADLVNSGVPVGQMLCPSNPGTVSEVFDSLLNDMPRQGQCVDLLGSPPNVQPDGTELINPCRRIITEDIAPGTEERRQLIERDVMLEHYNTNYTASWLLVRSGPILDASGNVVSRRRGCSNSLLSVTATAGPLSQAAVDQAAVPSSSIPLMGCGETTSTLSQPLGDHPDGSFLVRSFTVGPLLSTTGQKPAFSQGTERSGSDGWWATWTKQVQQDYQGFAPVHRGACNILMADTSVRSFVDENSNGKLEGPRVLGSNDAAPNDQYELPEQEFFSGAALRTL